MELCNNIRFLAPLRLILLSIDIIKIAVPLILVVVCMISLFRMVFKEEKELSEAFQVLYKKLIIAFSVYIVPTIVTLLLSIISDATGRENCIKNAKQDSISAIANNQINEIISSGVYSSANYNNLISLIEYVYDEDLRALAKSSIEEYKGKIPANVPGNDRPSFDNAKTSFTQSCQYTTADTESPAYCPACRDTYFQGNYNYGEYTSSVNGKTFTLFKQNTGPWSSVIGGNGCYLTSLSIILSGFYNDVTPCDFMFGINGTNPIKNFDYANVDGGLLTDISAENIRKQLQQGNMLIFEMKTPKNPDEKNICDTPQHHVAILDYDSTNDKVYIGDTTTYFKCNGFQSLDAALVGVVTVYYIEP